jgi:hypothetical protein
MTWQPDRPTEPWRSPPQPPSRLRHGRRQRSWWGILGLVLAVVLALFGLAIVALAVLGYIALGIFGSNK